MTNPIALKRLQTHVVQTQSRLYGACANKSPLNSENEASCRLSDSMAFFASFKPTHMTGIFKRPLLPQLVSILLHLSNSRMGQLRKLVLTEKTSPPILTAGHAPMRIRWESGG